MKEDFQKFRTPFPQKIWCNIWDSCQSWRRMKQFHFNLKKVFKQQEQRYIWNILHTKGITSRFQSAPLGFVINNQIYITYSMLPQYYVHKKRWLLEWKSPWNFQNSIKFSEKFLLLNHGQYLSTLIKPLEWVHCLMGNSFSPIKHYWGSQALSSVSTIVRISMYFCPFLDGCCSVSLSSLNPGSN